MSELIDRALRSWNVHQQRDGDGDGDGCEYSPTADLDDGNC